MLRRLALFALLIPVFAGCIDSEPPPVARKHLAFEEKEGDKKPAGDAKTATQPLKKIVFITNGEDPFWDALNAGLEQGKKDFEIEKVGLDAVRDVNSGDADGQIKRLQQYASSSDIAGIAISVIQADNPAIVAEMQNLQRKGIPVITVDGDVNRGQFRDARKYYLGTDNIVGGRVLGTAAKMLLESRKLEKGGYVQFAGFTDNDNARSRMDGFRDAVGDQFSEKDRMPDQMDRNKARDNVRNALTNHEEIVALVGIWAYNAPAITEVVQERRVREKTTVVTFDAHSIAIEDMAQGKIDAMVVQNPFDMGYQTVRLMKAMITGDEAVTKEMFPDFGQPDGDIYTTGLRLVVPNADSPVKKELVEKALGDKARVLEYMLLPEFQAWLKKYNLGSS